MSPFNPRAQEAFPIAEIRNEAFDITDFSWKYLGLSQSGGSLETSPGASFISGEMILLVMAAGRSLTSRWVVPDRAGCHAGNSPSEG